MCNHCNQGGPLKPATVLTAFILCFSSNTIYARDLTSLSLEELMNMEVTSVAKKAQPMSDAASAIFVITNEDIRRSGAQSIPEILRIVPGLQVAQIDANKWSVSARGFSGRFSNKLLVLIDGRTIYTPLFSGVYWNSQDTVLADIERIEVIRGPGGTLWGANAVNGIINIITKSASDTHGQLMSINAGNQGEGASYRYGGKLGDQNSYRAYAKRFNNDNFKTILNEDANDNWNMAHAGFRADTNLSDKHSMTVQGDVFEGYASQTIYNTSLTPPSSTLNNDVIKNSGGSLSLLWQYKSSMHSEWSVKSFISHAHRNDINLKQGIDTSDIELQHRLIVGDSNEITWGMGYREIEDELTNTFTVAFTPDHRTTKTINAFIQDAIKFNQDVTLTLGTKYEHNDFTGDEWQPSAKLLWKIDESTSIWSALSRAVRVPSRADSDLRLNVSAIPGFTPTLISIIFNPEIESENVTAFELGYRSNLRPGLSVDIAAFYNKYDDVVSQESNTPVFVATPPSHLLISSSNNNNLKANSYGLELFSRWQVYQDWRILFGYSIIEINVDEKTPNPATSTRRIEVFEKATPTYQAELRSQWSLSEKYEFDTSIYHNSSIRTNDLTGIVDIPDYTRVDFRFGWNAKPDLSLDIIAQNVFDERHAEFVTTDIIGSEIPRSISARLLFEW